MSQDMHPFAKYVAILGRGKTKQRHLTLEESRDSMGMILRGEVEKEQIGAFLMLLRLKEEAPEEIAGFALGARDTMDVPGDLPPVDIDWSTYAGKRIQLPWYTLSVLALVNAGYSVLMHGTEGHTPGRVYTREVLEALGFPAVKTLSQAAEQIRTRKFAYVPLEVMSPMLHHLINLRPLLGLRSPVHSFSRMLNPFNGRVMMQGIFHRGFMDVHAGAAQILGQPHMAVFRGEGGEIERRPNKPTQVWMTNGQDEPIVENWPALSDSAHQPANTEMDISDLARTWRGEMADDYALHSIIGTIAVTLRTMGKAASVEQAETMAKDVWQARDKGFVAAGA